MTNLILIFLPVPIMKLFNSTKKNTVTKLDNDALDLDKDALEDLINDMPAQKGADKRKKSFMSSKKNKSKSSKPSSNKSSNKKLRIFSKKKSKDKKVATVAPSSGGNYVDDKNPLSSDDFLATLEKKPKSNSDKLKWLLYALILLLLLAIAAYVFSIMSDNDTSEVIVDDNVPESVVQEPAATEGVELSPVDSPETDAAVDIEGSPDINTADSLDDSIATNDLDITGIDNIPDPEEILSADLPASDTVAKEEIDRLADEAARLEEQGKMIAEQVAMMDELTAKKEEQIALLEQQIALLEAQKESE